MKLMVKSAKEMLAVLDETKETFFKDRKCTYPIQNGNTNGLKLKSGSITSQNTSIKP